MARLIAAIKPAGRRSRLRAIELDDGQTILLSGKAIDEAGLEAGDEVEEAALGELVEREEGSRALDLSLRSLAQRPPQRGGDKTETLTKAIFQESGRLRGCSVERVGPDRRPPLCRTVGRGAVAPAAARPADAPSRAAGKGDRERTGRGGAVEGSGGRAERGCNCRKGDEDACDRSTRGWRGAGWRLR